MKPVVVAGVGPAGLSAAIHLRRSGVPVEVFERRDDVVASHVDTNSCAGVKKRYATYEELLVYSDLVATTISTCRLSWMSSPVAAPD